MTRGYYSHGFTCPRCHEPITNGSRMCRKCVQAFFLWLFRIYGYRPKLGKRPAPAGKGETNGRAILGALADGSMTTPKLATATSMTVKGVRYAANLLEKQGRIASEKGYRTVWGLADTLSYDNTG